MLKLVKGRPRTFTRRGIKIAIFDDDSQKTLVLDAEFEVVGGDEWADVVRNSMSTPDSEVVNRYVKRVAAIEGVECVDDEGNQLTEAEARLLLLSQREVERELARIWVEAMKNGPEGIKRKN